MFISKSRHGKATRNGPENRYWIGSDHKYVQYFNVIARFILHQFLLFRPSYINEIFSLLFLYSVWPEEYCYSLKYIFNVRRKRFFFAHNESVFTMSSTYLRTNEAPPPPSEPREGYVREWIFASSCRETCPLAFDMFTLLQMCDVRSSL